MFIFYRNITNDIFYASIPYLQIQKNNTRKLIIHQ